MGAVHIRNVPDSTLTALRERADRHGRSMQQELLQILEEAATAPDAAQSPPPLQLTTVRTGGRSSWRREEIYGDEGR